MKKLLKTLAFVVLLFSGLATVRATEIDLSSYSAMNMNVYQNSRVTKLTSGNNGMFTVEGYMFNDANCNTPNALYREIIFVNENDPSTEKAYRQLVSAKYNTFLNGNATATQNGKYDLSYAFYNVTVNPKSISNYKKTQTGAMANGSYLVYMRISDGKTSYLFPLKDAVLSDGTTMESTGKLPQGFEVINQDTRELRYIVGTVDVKPSETTQNVTSETTSEFKVFDATKYTKNDLADVYFATHNTSIYIDDTNFALAYAACLDDGTSKDVKVTNLIFNHGTGEVKIYDTVSAYHPKYGEGKVKSEEASQYAYRRFVGVSSELPEIYSIYVKIEYEGKSTIKVLREASLIDSEASLIDSKIAEWKKLYNADKVLQTSNQRENISTPYEAMEYYKKYHTYSTSGEIESEQGERINNYEYIWTLDGKYFIDKVYKPISCGQTANAMAYLLSDNFRGNSMGYIQYTRDDNTGSWGHVFNYFIIDGKYLIADFTERNINNWVFCDTKEDITNYVFDHYGSRDKLDDEHHAVITMGTYNGGYNKSSIGVNAADNVGKSSRAAIKKDVRIAKDREVLYKCPSCKVTVSSDAKMY